MVKQVKRYSTSFKVVLILSGAIAAGYIGRLFTGGKQVILADTVAESHPPKKHKARHKFRTHSPKITTAVLSKDTLTKIDRVVATKPQQEKPLTIAISPAPVKQLPDSSNNNTLYTTYVQPNVTGIVKLRQQDKFYADIIADIPANAKVTVLQKGMVYYKVSYNNNIGFVPKWVLHAK